MPEPAIYLSDRRVVRAFLRVSELETGLKQHEQSEMICLFLVFQSPKEHRGFYQIRVRGCSVIVLFCQQTFLHRPVSPFQNREPYIQILFEQALKVS